MGEPTRPLVFSKMCLLIFHLFLGWWVEHTNWNMFSQSWHSFAATIPFWTTCFRQITAAPRPAENWQLRTRVMFHSILHRYEFGPIWLLGFRWIIRGFCSGNLAMENGWKWPTCWFVCQTWWLSIATSVYWRVITGITWFVGKLSWRPIAEAPQDWQLEWSQSSLHIWFSYPLAPGWYSMIFLYILALSSLSSIGTSFSDPISCGSMLLSRDLLCFALVFLNWEVFPLGCGTLAEVFLSARPHAYKAPEPPC